MMSARSTDVLPITQFINSSQQFPDRGAISRSSTPSTPVHNRDKGSRSVSRRPQLISPQGQANGRQDSALGSCFDGAKVNENTKPLEVKDCLKQMIDFVKTQKLQFILGKGLSDEELENQLRPLAETATQLPIRLGYFSRELVMPLVILSLYDVIILIDDSTSVEFEEAGRRKEALKDILHLLFGLYRAVSDGAHEIKIRFLNGKDDFITNNLKEKDDINEVIDKHKFEGLSCLGTGLMRKILKPFVFRDEKPVKGTPRNLRQLERPLLVIFITDGEVEGEDRTWLLKAIRGTVNCLTAKGVGAKAVAFQFARIGAEDEAESLKDIAEYVDTVSVDDLMKVIGKRASGREAFTENDQHQILRLLLGPISTRYKNLANKNTEPLADVEGDFEDFGDLDDFDDLDDRE